jgi:hypothetical protein
LVISLLAVLGFLIVPLAFSRNENCGPIRLLYFVAVGLGYIAVEIVFIQRFVLFLGHPTYALTVVVFLLMLSSGAGSLISRNWLPQAGKARLPLLMIVAVLAIYLWVLPQLLNAMVGLALTAKLLVSAVLLVPLGFAMGMPFPTGLRILASMPVAEFPASASNAVEWAWAMNAGASVLGSVLAMLIAIEYGLNATLLCGAMAYAVAFLLFHTLKPACT